MKETFYFSHDYDPTSDPKIQAMLGRYGAKGYGIFWRIIEMLHAENEHKLSRKQYVLLALANQMSTNVKEIEKIIKDCIELFELFNADDDFIWSNRVWRNIATRKQISELRSLAGKKSAEYKKIQNNSTNVQQMLTIVEQSITKETKEKEIKENDYKKTSQIVFNTDKFKKASFNETLELFKEYEKEVGENLPYPEAKALLIHCANEICHFRSDFIRVESKLYPFDTNKFLKILKESIGENFELLYEKIKSAKDYSQHKNPRNAIKGYLFNSVKGLLQEYKLKGFNDHQHILNSINKRLEKSISEEKLITVNSDNS